MRRKEKEITNRAEIDEIINRAAVCRLAMVDKNKPYIVPLNFGYDGKSLFFHSATQGRKLEILKKNNSVCFELDVDVEIKKGEKACDWSCLYQSVIGSGRAELLEKPDEIKAALDIIMRHYQSETFEYNEKLLNIVVVIKVDIERVSGKRSL